MYGVILLRATLVLSLVGSLIAAPRTGGAASTSYSVEDIGSLVGTGKGQFDMLTNVAPVEVNNVGEIISNSLPVDQSFGGVPFTNIEGKVRRLGKEKAFSFALDLNDAGEITGYVTSLDDTRYERIQAVVWRDRSALELPTLGGPSSAAVGINEDGEIVGYSGLHTDRGAATHAVVWQNDIIDDLGTLGGANSFANDLNASGLVIGQSNATDRDGLYPCVWEDGKITELPLPGGLPGFATALNDDGVIVGFARDESNALTAVRWIDRTVESLPTLVEGGTSIVYDINADGAAVGWSGHTDGNSTIYRAVLWEGNDVFDLNDRLSTDIGYVLDTALAINDRGQILAAGTGTDGLHHGVLLTPSASTTIPQLVAASRFDFAVVRRDFE